MCEGMINGDRPTLGPQCGPVRLTTGPIRAQNERLKSVRFCLKKVLIQKCVNTCLSEVLIHVQHPLLRSVLTHGV